MVRGSLSWTIPVVVVGLAFATEEPRAPAREADPRGELDAICRQSTEGGDPFVGRAALDDLRAILAAEQAQGRANFDRAFDLGVHLIRLGLHEEALASTPRLAPPGHALGDPYLLLRAAAHLQLSFDRNCIDHPQADSCILPIAPSSVHRLAEHSRAAGDLYASYLDRHPTDTHVRWLLNVSRMLSADFPSLVPGHLRLAPQTLTPTARMPRRTNIAPDLGVNVVDLAGGAVMDDFDGDGLLDLISSSRDPCGPMHAFRSTGDGRFEDVTDAWGLRAQTGALNLVHADYDGDGMLDLLLLRGAWLGERGRIRNSLLRNDLKGSSGRFLDATFIARIAHPAYPTQAAAWADYDLDGDLDLYVGNESSEATLMRAGNVTTGYPSQLFRNNGDGTFTDVARAAGVQNLRFAKGVAWGDYDDDGDPDLYVSNFGPNRLYRNNGDGTFIDVAVEQGVDDPVGPSFATWFFDYDNDGDQDIFVADYAAKVADVTAVYSGTLLAIGRPVIHRNDRDHFTTLSSELGFDRPLLPMGANYGDLDNDGFLDIYLGTGNPDVDALMPNVMYRNHAGRDFEDVTLSGGFGHLQKGHGIAFGDLDNDGDQDLFEQMGGAYPFDTFGNVLFENPGSGNSWIVLQLAAKGLNRAALGARVRFDASGSRGPVTVFNVVGGGGSFGSSSLQLEAGLGGATQLDLVTIRWPTGGTQEFRGPFPVNTAYKAVEGELRLQSVGRHRLTLGGPRSRAG